jgi:hypothetical protein
VLRRDVGVAFKSATIRLTAEEVKNLSASGVAYKKIGAILSSPIAPNLAPKDIGKQVKKVPRITVI